MNEDMAYLSNDRDMIKFQYGGGKILDFVVHILLNILHP